MATVPLSFQAPDIAGLTSMVIYESATPTGSWVQIEAVTAIGTYPNYITSYTTSLATNVNDWFMITWKSGTVETEPSNPIQGGTISLVGEVADRVMQRDRSLDRAVVIQEAEAVIERQFMADPYALSKSDIAPNQTYNILSGLTYMTMARALLERMVRQGAFQTATIGLISMRTGDTANRMKNVETLVAMANNLLGVSFSTVMLLEDIKIGNSIGRAWLDQSRLVLETELL